MTVPGGGDIDSTDAMLPDDRRLVVPVYTAHFTK